MNLEPVTGGSVSVLQAVAHGFIYEHSLTRKLQVWFSLRCWLDELSKVNIENAQRQTAIGRLSHPINTSICIFSGSVWLQLEEISFLVHV